MFKKLALFVLSFLVLIGCAVKSRKEQQDFRKFFSQKQFLRAEQHLNESTLKKDEKNKLLYLMELGNLNFYQERYYKATRIFVEANELVDQLYTKSIREALASSILNDNSKTFYGSIFERSQLYQYQALSFLKLAQRGFYYKEKTVEGKVIEEKVMLSKDKIRKNYNRVRSTLIAWDTFFQEMNRIRGIKTFLKHDLLAKQMAGQLHEALGTKRDKEIALQLYKDAFDIFIELGPTQKIFNTEFKKYNAEIKDFYNKKIKRSKVLAKSFTQKYKDTKDSLTLKILSLAKKIRRNSYKSMMRKYAPTKSVKKKLKAKKTNNVSIILEKGIISELEGKDYSYNLRTAIDGIKSPGTKALVNGIGVPILTYFALGPLGLGYASHHGNVTMYSRHGAGEVLTKEVGIEFELPYAKESNEKNIYKIEIYKKGKKILEKKLSFLSSLSDISFINAQEMIQNSFKKRATRVGIKYVTAIIAAYGTYKKIKESAGELFAKPAALGQFLISQKLIKETEKADARHWTTLPASVLNIELALNPGKYDIHFKEVSPKNGQVIRKVKLGQLEAKARDKSLFSYRTF